MNIVISICRILVGSLFIVSGLIKANDALGFSYKLAEYFAKDVLNMEFMLPYALPLAAFICVVEIVLGFATLLGGKMKLVSWSLLLMIIFFTFLTFYSAYFNKVLDCGCFGDALHLTPWQSFTKDIVLLILILPIFIHRAHISLNNLVQDRVILPISIVIVALFSVLMLKWSFPWVFTLVILAIALIMKQFISESKREWSIAAMVTVFCTGFCYYTYAHLPIKDFRPFAIGKNIEEGMKTAEELGKKAPVYAYNYTLTNSVSGDVKKMTSIEYMDTKIWEDTTWVISETDEKPFLVEAGYEPPIHDFSITNADGDDITYSVLSDDNYYFFIVAYDISKSAGAPQKALNKLYADATKANLKLYGLSASSDGEIQDFKLEHQSPIDYYSCDAITLKTMVRSNPGIMLIKKGTIIAMWHYNDLPDFSAIKTEYIK